MKTNSAVEHSSELGGTGITLTSLRGQELKAALACILFIVPVLALSGCSRSQAAAKRPNTEVLISSPVQQDVAVQSEWVATLDGYVNAEIRPQVSGYRASGWRRWMVM
jgi:membrane fusion protein (multidrug efflux system)